jgi:hypothetical protein
VNPPRLLRAILQCAVLLLVASPLAAQAIPNTLGQFLRTYAQFSDADLEELEQGQPVAKLLPARAKDEVAVMGAVRIRASGDLFLGRFRDIIRFKKGGSVPEIGRFGSSPAPADVASLTLEPRDIDSLRECRVGDCRLKLSADAIRQFQLQIPPFGTNKVELANRLFRDVLFDRIRTYLQSGDAGLLDYHDQSAPVSLALQFRQLLADSPYLGEYASKLAACLRLFPRCNPAVESFVYWSKENYGHGLQPVVSVTHIMIDRERVRDGEMVWAASKQLYANHYFEGSPGLSLLVDAPPVNDAPTFYLIYLNRTRADSLRGILAFFIRGTIRRRTRAEMKDRLDKIKAGMESAYPASISAGARAANSWKP